MFGTGVDITRLNLMFVGGQPNNCTVYQATGRRENGAIGSILAECFGREI